MQVIPENFLHLVKTTFAFDKKHLLVFVSVRYFIILCHNYNNLWI